MKTLTLFITILAAAMTAAGDGSLSLAPAVVMLRGHAGQSTTQTMRLTNGGMEPYSFDLKAEDIVVRDGRRVAFPAGRLPGSIAATAAFSRKSVTLAPGETVRVDVTVTIPTTPAGRAVLALFHGTTKMERAGVAITGSLGMLLTFSLSDELRPATTPLSVHPPDSSSYLRAAQELSNGGSEPFVAIGTLAIINSAGALVGRTQAPPRRLLPGEKTDVRAEYTGKLAPGHYRALMTYQIATNSVTSSAEFDVR